MSDHPSGLLIVEFNGQCDPALFITQRGIPGLRLQGADPARRTEEGTSQGGLDRSNI
jgi:hypothetical protein